MCRVLWRRSADPTGKVTHPSPLSFNFSASTTDGLPLTATMTTYLRFKLLSNINNHVCINVFLFTRFESLKDIEIMRQSNKYYRIINYTLKK